MSATGYGHCQRCGRYGKLVALIGNVWACLHGCEGACER